LNSRFASLLKKQTVFALLTLALTCIPGICSAQKISKLVIAPAILYSGGDTVATITLNGPAGVGGAVITLSSSDTTVATVPPTVTVPNSLTSATFNIHTIPLAANRTVDIKGTLNNASVGANLLVKAPILQSISLSPSTLYGGKQCTATVNLQGQAPGSGLVVNFKSTYSDWGGPATYTVPGGATTSSFTFFPPVVSTKTSCTVTATVDGSSKSASLTINAPVITNLTLDPSTVAGGTTSVGTVTINSPAPRMGLPIVVTSNSASATVSKNLLIPYGQTSATFNIKTKAVSKQTLAKIAVSELGSTANATLTIVNVSLTGFSLDPSTVTGGTNVVGTVTLSAAAPDTGIHVVLASNQAAAPVPGNVLIAPGSKSTSFNIPTLAVSQATSAKISATFGATTITDTLTVNAPTLASVSVAPTVVVGPANSTLTATLSGPAPVGGTQINLSSNNAAAQVPASLTIAAGATSGSTTISTTAVSSQTVATLTGKDPSGTSQSGQLTIQIPSGLAGSPWPKFRGDTQNTGQGLGSGATGTKKWVALANQTSSSSVAIDVDGTLYVGADNGKLYALKPDGTTKWTYTTGSSIVSSPVIGSDGSIYFGSYDSYLYALNNDGTLKWSYETGGEIESSPTVAPDGTVYFASDDTRLYALTSGGVLKWRYALNNYVPSSPALASDGTIYIGSLDDNLYAFKPSGDLKWIYPTNRPIYGAPAVGSDGTVYFGSDQVYAVTSTGSLKWSYNTNTTFFGGAGIASDGTIYIGDTNADLFAFTPTGAKKWAFGMATGVRSSPAIAADGTIYIGCFDNNVYAVTPAGAQKWIFATPSYVISSPSIGLDGTVYFSSTGIFAIK